MEYVSTAYIIYTLSQLQWVQKNIIILVHNHTCVCVGPEREISYSDSIDNETKQCTF